MIKVLVKVGFTDIEDKIKDIAAYMSAKTLDANGQPLYDKVTIFDEDENVIKDLFSLSVKELSRLLHRFTVGVDEQENEVEFTLSLPENVRSVTEEVLTKHSISYVAYSVLAKWCDISSKEDAETYEDSMQESAKAIKEALYDRTSFSRNDILNREKWN